MKKVILAALLIFVVSASPVLAALDCCNFPGDSHAQESQTDKAPHPEHNCCHANTFNTETPIHSVSIDFTSSKIAVEQMQLISLYEPSPIIKPPAQV